MGVIRHLLHNPDMVNPSQILLRGMISSKLMLQQLLYRGMPAKHHKDTRLLNNQALLVIRLKDQPSRDMESLFPNPATGLHHRLDMAPTTDRLRLRNLQAVSLLMGSSPNSHLLPKEAMSSLDILSLRAHLLKLVMLSQIPVPRGLRRLVMVLQGTALRLMVPLRWLSQGMGSSRHTTALMQVVMLSLQHILLMHHQLLRLFSLLGSPKLRRRVDAW